MKNVGIIGGGAAGIFCAITIKQQLKNKVAVTILERQSRIGKKLLQTGSGKCNLTNTNIDVTHYNTDLIGDALQSFSPQKCIEVFNDLGILVRVDDYGRVYPHSERATTVLEMLMHNLDKLDVEVICNYDVLEIKKADQFIVYNKEYDFRNFDYLVVATGGSSSIKFENRGYHLAKSLGHSITSLAPGLVALNVEENTKSLRGLRVKANAKLIKDSIVLTSSSGEIQFKDQGLSGIAIFDLSRFYIPGCIVSLDLIPNMELTEIKTFLNKGINLETSLMGVFPKMIVKDLLNRSNNNIDKCIEIIKDFQFNITGLYGFNNAQITVGGIDLKEVSPLDFSSLIVNNMYIIGEALDVDGACGGYNLHFAWMSGYLSALAIVNLINERGIV